MPRLVKSELAARGVWQKEVDSDSAFHGIVDKGMDRESPWLQLKNQIYLGDEQFVAKMMSQLGPDRDLSEIPGSQRRPAPRTLEEYEFRKGSNRDDAIAEAYNSGGYSMKEIGDYFGLHYSRVSRILKAKDKT